MKLSGPELSLVGRFLSWIQFHYLWLPCSCYLFLTGSILEACTFIRIFPFLPGCPFYWHIVACSSLLWFSVFLWFQLYHLLFSFLILLIWVLSFFLDEPVVVQWQNHVQFFVTPLAAAFQASLSFTISLSLLKLMSVELVMPSNHLILCHSLLLLPSIFPIIKVFPWVSSLHQTIGASASVLPMNSQDWFPLGLTGLMSLQSKGLLRFFSSITFQKYQFFSAQLSF